MRKVFLFFRALYQYGVGWLFCMAYIPAAALLLALTLGRRKDTLGAAIMRGWGRGLLRIFGVRLELAPEVEREFATRRARVLTFNHASTLDLFVGAALTPEGTVTVVKKELRYIPFVGQILYLLDVVLLDRQDRKEATGALRALGERLRQGRHTVMIAPEGTRSLDGRLGPFKRGPFHLAIEAQVPIVPIVFEGCERLCPRFAWSTDPGVVVIRALPEVATAGLDAADAAALAESLRQTYLQALGEG